mgnify:CR=1 FL=1
MMSERPDGFEAKRTDLGPGPIHYLDSGDRGNGETLVFVHGFGVNGRLWDGVADRLREDARCILPDWPMGSHPEAMRPDADLTPPAQARLVSEFLRSVDLDGATIVGNDSGGAVSQMLVTRHPERIARLVLTICDCFENFPPEPFKTMFKGLRVPGAPAAFARSLKVSAIRRGPLAYGKLTSRPMEEATIRAFVDPMIHDTGVRDDAMRFVAGADARDTMDAASKLPDLQIPALLVWGAEDTFFTIADARRLAELIPDGRLVEVSGARTFVPLDDPGRVAEEIAGFLAERPLPAGTASA